MKAIAKKIKDNEWIAEVDDIQPMSMYPILHYKYPIVSTSEIEWLEHNNWDGKGIEGALAYHQGSYSNHRIFRLAADFNPDTSPSSLYRSGSQPGKEEAKATMQEQRDMWRSSYLMEESVCEAQGDRIILLEAELAALKSEEQAIVVLNSQIQERDNRIKELEKERDELACDFVHWVRSGEYGYHPGKKNWKLPDMSPTYTTQQLLEEYKKTQTK